MYQIISDGSCDLSEELIKKHHLEVVPFYVSMDGNKYLKEKVEIDVRDFYQQMVDNSNVYPKTSMPTVDDYYRVFEKYAKDGIDIICICITTKFSGSYNSALNAMKDILEKYSVKVTVIDATVNTCIQGLLVLEAARMQDNGLSYEECIEKINEIKKTARIFFTVGSMDYLRHGGRIGKVLGLIGATLKIKPLIVLKEGEIFPLGLCFRRTQSILKVVEHMKKHFEENKLDPSNYRFVVGYGYDEEEGLQLKDRIQAIYPQIEVMIFQIGATIGVHTGPYPIGVGIIQKYDA